MVVLRLIARLFLGFALALMAAALWVWLAGYDVTRATGAVWYELDPGSLNLFQVIVQRYLDPALWDRALVPLLRRPFWEAATGLFIVLMVAGGLASMLAVRRSRGGRFFKRK